MRDKMHPGCNSEHLNSKIAQVQERLGGHLREIEGEPVKPCEVVRIIERPFSSVVQLSVEIRNTKKSYLMKSVTNHPVISNTTRFTNQAIVEYEILNKLYRYFFNVEQCSVPKPILVLPNIETFVMEFVEGNMLIDKNRYARYFESQRKFRELQQYYFMVGKWLKHFHEFTGIESASSESLSGVIERCNLRLKFIDELHTDLCPKSFLLMVRNYIKGQLQEVDSVPISGRHGDFGPWNIIITGNKGVSVIDFMGYKKDPLPVDIMKMLIFLEDEKRCLTSSPRRVNALKNSYIEGYGGLPRIPEPVLNVCEAMQRIVSIWSRLATSNNKIYHELEKRRVISAHVEWFAEKSKRKSVWCSDDPHVK